MTQVDEKEANLVKEDDDKEIVSLKQAKFDVFKFGIKGFSKEEQESAKIQLAVKLGAKVDTLINVFLVLIAF